MKRNGFFGIKQVNVFLLFVFTFSFMTAKATFTHAQTKELPKSWMPKWKVGDWWREKRLDKASVMGESSEPQIFKFEIVRETNLKGKPGFEIKITPESNSKYPLYPVTFFVVDKKHLSVRKYAITEKCKGQKGLSRCGGDKGDDYSGAYPFIEYQGYSPMLPAFPLKVGRMEIRFEKYKKNPLIPYVVQEVHRVSAQELIAKGYKPGGLFKPTGNYYEVTISEINPYDNESHIQSKQIWSPNSPYWVYGTGTSDWFLIEHSWK